MMNFRTEPALTLREATKVARNMYLTGHYCSEAILAAIGQAWAAEYDPAILKMASPFGAGVAGKADLCGCVSGGSLAIGFLFGRNNLKEDLTRCWELTGRFHERFEKDLGSTSCEHFTKGKFNRITHMRCYRLVSRAIKILWELIEEEAKTCPAG